MYELVGPTCIFSVRVRARPLSDNRILVDHGHCDEERRGEDHEDGGHGGAVGVYAHQVGAPAPVQGREEVSQASSKTEKNDIENMIEI